MEVGLCRKTISHSASSFVANLCPPTTSQNHVAAAGSTKHTDSMRRNQIQRHKWHAWSFYYILKLLVTSPLQSVAVQSAFSRESKQISVVYLRVLLVRHFQFNIVEFRAMDRWLKTGSLKKILKTSITVPPIAVEEVRRYVQILYFYYFRMLDAFLLVLWHDRNLVERLLASLCPSAPTHETTHESSYIWSLN